MDAQAEAPASHPRHYSSRVWLQPVYQTVSPLFEAGIYPPYFVCSVQLLRRCRTISQTELRVNEEIRGREVRVVTSEGEQLGIMPVRDALRLAQERDLDLVEVAPTAKPPVCRIMDYGKYRFEQSKREKEARKNQHVVEIKEVRLGLNTDVGDFNTKVRHATRFLGAGNKVKVSIRFRGRELGHPEIGFEAMKRFAEACTEFGNVERSAKMEGRHMLMFLGPKPTK